MTTTITTTLPTTTKTTIYPGKMAIAAEIKALRQQTEKVTLVESQKAYTEIINSYEKNIASSGTVCYRMLAEHAASSYSREARSGVRILDVGAGTGLVAVALKKEGFVHMDALEPNEAMLNEARKHLRYENYYMEYLTTNRQCSIETGSYDVVTACGVFAKSAHFDPRVLSEIIRMTKPGGFVVLVNRFTDNEDVIENLEENMEELADRNKWKRLSRDIWPGYNYIFDDDGIIWKYQVL